MRKKISWHEYRKAIKYIVRLIKKSGKNYNKIITFKRGGFIPAAHLAYQLDIQEIGTNFDFTPDINTLIVDDISDSGETLEPFKQFDTACLCYKSGTRVIPKFFYKVYKKTIWVVFPWEQEEIYEELRDRDRFL
ncbi:MAG: phosphoribosyltransferase [Candidatus Hodarchaeota archaeon]